VVSENQLLLASLMGRQVAAHHALVVRVPGGGYHDGGRAMANHKPVSEVNRSHRTDARRRENGTGELFGLLAAKFPQPVRWLTLCSTLTADRYQRRQPLPQPP